MADEGTCCGVVGVFVIIVIILVLIYYGSWAILGIMMANPVLGVMIIGGIMFVITMIIGVFTK